jgi:probable O-glycosylation ligase (exosortase A-associated)
MRDIVVLAFLIGCIGATIWRPWLGVLSLAVFSYLNPHSFAWGFITTFPVYLVMFIVAFFAMLTCKDRQALPRDWRIYVFYALWFYFLLTTLNAMTPWAAWPKLIVVSKIYLPFILTLLLINTREKLYYLIITIAGSIGLVAVKGGIWAIAHGFSYRVYGPPNTQFYENNAFAIAVLMVIPLLIFWRRETRNRWINYGLTAAIPLCFSSALSSWSRGALITIAVLAAVLIWESKRKYLAIPLMLLGAYLVFGQLPEQWFSRMETIQTYEEDSSAMDRIQAWTDGFQYALANPLLGAGFEGWRYVTMRDWHSSYIEIMAEHGFIAFAMWFSLLLGSIISLTRLNIISGRFPEMAWVKNYATMLRASLIAYAAGTVFLGLSYWDIFYHLVFISVLVKKFAQEEMTERGLIKRMSPVQYPANVMSQPGSNH